MPRGDWRRRTPIAADFGDDKWVDFKTFEFVGNVSPEDVHKAQLTVVVRARSMGLSNAEAKELLSALGIDQKVGNHDDDRKDS